MLRQAVFILALAGLTTTSFSLLAQSSKRRKEVAPLRMMISQLDAGFSSNHQALLATLPIDFSQLPPELETIVGLQVHISKLGVLDSVFIPQMPSPPGNEVHLTVLDVARRRLRRFSSKIPLYKSREVDAFDYVDVCVCRDSLIRKMININTDNLGRYVPGPLSFVNADSDPVVLNWDSVIAGIPFPDIVRDKGTKKAPPVSFRVLVSPEGSPAFIWKLYSPSDELAQLVRTYLSQLRFEPARLGGKPLYFWKNIVVNYPSREAEE